MMIVRTATSFYILRFLLGAAEAGFIPGILLYLTYWYPAQRRGRVMALFLMGIPISGVIGGPVSGWIMQTFHGVNGWAGWQWLFLLEALPAFLAGVVALFYLTDDIHHAKWLSEEERRVLQNAVKEEAGKKEHHSMKDAFSEPKRRSGCRRHRFRELGRQHLRVRGALHGRLDQGRDRQRQSGAVGDRSLDDAGEPARLPGASAARQQVRKPVMARSASGCAITP